MTATAAETMADAIVVRLGAGRFAVGLDQVAEVGKVPPLTRVPGVPDWVAGVANWRGRILAVLDLRSLLGAEVDATRPSARVVVLTGDAGTVAVIVDAVVGTIALGDAGEPLPGGLPDVAALVHSQVPREDGPLAVLDINAVMRLREQLPRSRRSA